MHNTDTPRWFITLRILYCISANMVVFLFLIKDAEVERTPRNLKHQVL